MALLQISEPGQTQAPHQRKVALGIDLGTTNSVVAVVRSGNPVALQVGGTSLIPSVARYLADGSVEVGAKALQGFADDPLNTVRSVKRLLGRSHDELSLQYERNANVVVASDGELLTLKTAAGLKSPVEISADILMHLADVGREAVIGGSVEDIDGVVITVPAYFDDGQRQATKDAAKLAGLNVLRLINEPTAAAIAYGLDQQDGGTVAVYDLGGGTFDVSVLRMERGVFQVLSTSGDTALGGDDFDMLVVSWFLQQHDIRDSGNISDTDYARLTLQAKAAKESLAVDGKAAICLGDKTSILTADIFASLVQPLIDKTLQCCGGALLDAGVSVNDVDDVVLVGGSTRALAVQEAVTKYFVRPPLTSVDPDEVVALGAAIQADILIGNKPDADVLLLDVIPLSLGIETMGGLVEKVIHRNTTIPVTRAQEFTTYQDGQTAMSMHVLQGDRELVDDCRSLAKFTLRAIPPMVAGAARIQVTFQVDADGLLSVAAKEVSTGTEASVDVKPSYGLTDGEVADMLQQSFSHAEEDKERRQLAEHKVEAKQLLLSTQAALSQDGDLLDQQEREKIDQAIAQLNTEIDCNVMSQLLLATENLARFTEGFAAKRMDRSIKQALAGKTLDEI